MLAGSRGWWRPCNDDWDLKQYEYIKGRSLGGLYPHGYIKLLSMVLEIQNTLLFYYDNSYLVRFQCFTLTIQIGFRT